MHDLVIRGALAAGGLGSFDVKVVEVHDLIHGVCAGDDCFPNFGLANQRIIDAMERSIESRSREVVCTE